MLGCKYVQKWFEPLSIFSFCKSHFLSLAFFVTLHKCKFFFCRARAVARVIGSSREWVVEVELVVPGRPLGLFPASNNGPHRQATVLPWMAQRPAMGRIQARRVGGPAIVAPSGFCGRTLRDPRGDCGPAAICGCRWPRNGNPWEERAVVGISWIGAPLDLWSPTHFFSGKNLFQMKITAFFWYFGECLMSMRFPKKVKVWLAIELHSLF